MSAPRNPTGPATGVAGSLPVAERTVVQITSWPGKPTSGRFVYASLSSPGHWYWQCDLHYEDDAQPDQYGELTTWQDALAGALAHAAVCPFVSASVRPGTLTRPRPTGS